MVNGVDVFDKVSITTPLHVMKLEIVELGKHTIDSISDKEFEIQMRAILIKGFSDFQGKKDTLELRARFEQRKNIIFRHIKTSLSDDLRIVGSYGLMDNLKLTKK